MLDRIGIVDRHSGVRERELAARRARALGVVEALRRFAAFFGDDVVVEHPTGSGTQRTLAQVADDLEARLVAIFLDVDGRRPVFGGYELFQTDPRWHDQLWFHEYFHGDTGAGLGASHQTGWTGYVAELLLRRTRPVAPPGAVAPPAGV